MDEKTRELARWITKKLYEERGADRAVFGIPDNFRDAIQEIVALTIEEIEKRFMDKDDPDYGERSMIWLDVKEEMLEEIEKRLRIQNG